MAFVPGGTFMMGSNDHYPEERPSHPVTVDGFAMDRHPVTNGQYTAFVGATGHVTTAEVPPDPAEYPGALPAMLYAGSLVFVQPRGPVDLRDVGNWWAFVKAADRRHPTSPDSSIAGLDDDPVMHVSSQVGASSVEDQSRCRRGRQPGAHARRHRGLRAVTTGDGEAAAGATATRMRAAAPGAPSSTDPTSVCPGRRRGACVR